MQRIHVWQGYHSKQIEELFHHSWTNDDLLICCPPGLRDFSFVAALPSGVIDFRGSWNAGVPETIRVDSGTKHAFPDKPVLGVFTTGTTRATPKLVLYSKKNITACADAILSLFAEDKIKSVFCYPQPYHVFGLLLGYALSQHKGMNLLRPHGRYSDRHHQDWLDGDKSALLTLATPAHLRDLVAYCRRHGAQPQASYAGILGGASVMRSDWLAAKEVLKIQKPSIGYGCSEASPGIMHLAPGQAPQEDGEVGLPLAGVTIAADNAGGFRFTGDNVCLATIEGGQVTFPESIFVRDQLVKRDDGVYVFRARTDLVLNRGGEKFSLDQIEMVLKRQLNIEAICVAVADGRLGEELGILAQRAQPTNDQTRQAIYKTLEKEFGKKFSQENFQEVDALPVNFNSKVDRKLAVDVLAQQLRAKAGAGS